MVLQLPSSPPRAVRTPHPFIQPQHSETRFPGGSLRAQYFSRGLKQAEATGLLDIHQHLFLKHPPEFFPLFDLLCLYSLPHPVLVPAGLIPALSLKQTVKAVSLPRSSAREKNLGATLGDLRKVSRPTLVARRRSSLQIGSSDFSENVKL